MPGSPVVVYCIREETECPLLRAVREAAKKIGGDIDSIAARVLRVNIDYPQKMVEAWLRVSGSRDAIKSFEDSLKHMKGISYQLIYVSKFNAIYRVLIPGHEGCSWFKQAGFCPLASAPVGFMGKSVVLTPEGVLHEYIIAWKKGVEYLKSMGCKVLLLHSIEEYDYMLSVKQENALIYAYLMGYYSYPRRISLKALASKLGLSVSTLAELLRKAEAKVIEAFIRHELPHHLVRVVVKGSDQLRSLEAKLANNKKVDKAIEGATAPS